ncbi:substrate-binding domain-containing protein [Sphaerotilus sp.]|uniref:substrate-binding domain-containing protein n=1 Tax=Sphaerotilus sp. TaxID=2093942 RepID=UPI0034E1D904
MTQIQTHGVCTNLPESCRLAASRQPQALDTGGGRCSECGATLMAPAGAVRSAAPVRWLLPLLALLLVGSALWWWLHRTPASPVAPAAAVTAVVAVASASGPPVTGEAGSSTIRLHGSNTVGAALAPALVKAFLAREGYTSVERQPGANAEESVLIGRRADGASLRVELQAHGTATAFQSLAAGAADIGMASRAVKADELAATSVLGDLSAEGSEYVIALDGVALIVHPSNPLQRLSIAQIRDLFSGRVTDWAAVGGPAGPVTVYARDDKSGTWDTFRALVLDKQPLVASAHRHEDSRELSDAVAADPQAIGFVGLPYARQAKTLAVADGSANALRPSRFTVATEDYALSRRLYFYVARNAPPLVRKLADFAVSDEAQKIAQAEGYIGQIPEADEGVGAAAAEALPTEYTRLTHGARRLAVNLRFKPGVDKLDNKALRDMARISRLLESRLGPSQHLMLLGFSDGQGDPCANLTISVQRAQSVARDLGTYGLKAAAVQGYGSAAPVASNDTSSGRERNRRVEVWMSDRAIEPVAPARCQNGVRGE